MIVAVAVFFVLVLISAAAIVYPLLPGHGSPAPVQDVPAVGATDEDIERAVRDLRRARGRSGDFCPACGSPHKPVDRFCVKCGGELPQAAPPGPICPACGTALHEGDRFCSKCGHSMAPAEVA
jgi:predicted nucleic acid-binding Zn ribbon protein